MTRQTSAPFPVLEWTCQHSAGWRLALVPLQDKMELGSHLDPCIPTRDSMQVFQHNFDNFQRLSVVLPKPRTIFLRFGSNDFRIHRHCRSVYFPNCTQCLKAKLAQLTATHRVCQNLLDVQHVATSPDTGVLKAISSSLWSFSTRQCEQNDRKAHRRTSQVVILLKLF